jgi:dephospho-CoA kinase
MKSKLNTKPKLCIVSHARSGKDTLAEILKEEFGYTFQSSSQAASKIFIYDRLKSKYGYETPEECFEDRMSKRQEWFELIQEYNSNDKAALAKVIMESSDAYVGMRDEAEIESCLKQGVFDLVVWVDASKRVPDEPSTSFNIKRDVAHFIIDNNTTLEDFRNKAVKVFKYILG